MSSADEQIQWTRIGGDDALGNTIDAASALEPAVVLGPYRLVESLGVGVDGAAFRGLADQGEWEVRRLDCVHADATRWSRLRWRLTLLGRLPPHPALLSMRIDLHRDPPLAAIVWSMRRPLADFLGGGDTLELERVPANLTALAEALALAHAVGLDHGDLAAETVFVEPDGRWTMDLSGVDCCGRRQPVRSAADRADDILGLGQLLGRLLPLLCRQDVPTGDRGAARPTTQAAAIEASMRALAAEMTAADPAERPLADETANRLREWARRPRDGANSAAAPSGDSMGADFRGEVTAIGGEETIGRFRLLAKLGEGGMGTVYRAIDEANDAVVAVKLLTDRRSTNPAALKRFLKESRMLERVNSPHVTRLIDANHDGNRYYLAMECVEGRNLNQALNETPRFDERRALGIAVDVARGLAAAHAQRIIHRDIKPENILLIETGDRPMAKLTDFGLAREIVQSESLQITRAGTILGTPLYMSPEQFTGSEPEDPRTDVYALGATLFHMLAGRPPFVGASFQELLVKHTTTAAPDLLQLAPNASGAVAAIVARCLQKKPAQRYVDADALLADLEAALRGQPSSHASHPKLPATPPERVVCWVFQWELTAAPARLWPLVSNTERVNRAMGLPAVAFETRDREQGGARRFGAARIAGLRLSWEEHPFEWIEGKRMGVLREFRTGPFVWFLSVVEFHARADGGCTLVQTIRVEPRGISGRVVAAIEIGFKARRSLDRIYRRIDESLRSPSDPARAVDPFERPTSLPASRQRRLLDRIAALVAEGAAADAADCIGLFLSNASEQDVARIRPIALARRFNVDANAMIEACLRAVRHGLLILRWDVLCPLCQLAAAKADALTALREHENCPACNVHFAADLNRSVEMVFHAHPDIRQAEFGSYCAGGPAHSPHVAAQARVAAGERLELALDLPTGAYRLRGPQLPWSLDLEVVDNGATRRLEISLDQSPRATDAQTLLPNGQHLVLANPSAIELIVRIERIVRRDDVVTAAVAMAMPLFRELFPGEVLAPGRLAQIASIAVLMTQLAEGPNLYSQLGDAAAHAKIQRAFQVHGDLIRKHRGTVVKTVSEGVLAVFDATTMAAQAAVELQKTLANDPQLADCKVRAALHRGLATVATIDGRLDYFGATIKQTIRLLERAGAAHLVVAETTVSDPEVDAIFRGKGLLGRPLEVRGANSEARCPARRYELPS